MDASKGEAACLLPDMPSFTTDALFLCLRLLPCPQVANRTHAEAAELSRNGPSEATLLHCKAVSRGWLFVSRQVLADPEWLAVGLPLTTLLELKASAAAVRARLEAHPDEVMTMCKRRSPLHVATASGASAEIVELLLERFPRAAAMADLRHVLPLHLAVQHCRSAKVCEMLLQHHPEGRTLATRERKVPLHLACESRAPVEVVRLLLGRFADAGAAAAEHDARDAHIAERGVAQRSLRGCSAACENAARLCGRRDQLALHLAAAHGAEEAVISTLLRAYPGGAARHVCNGRHAHFGAPAREPTCPVASVTFLRVQR